MNPERSTLFLMANLGSEMLRMFGHKQTGQRDLMGKSADRALAIISSLTEHTDLGSGAQEIQILKDIINDMLSPAPTLSIQKRDLDIYFNPFASRLNPVP